MTYEQFKSVNLGWDDGSTRWFGDTYMRKNYEISRGVKREFYRHYNRHATTPQKGDLIEFVNNNSFYPHAAVESVNKYGMMTICEQASTHTDGKHFSTSGGAWTSKHISHFEFAGYEYRRFWTWGAHGAGAHQGIYFTILVKKWRQKDMPNLIPMNEVCFLYTYYQDIGKVVIKNNSGTIFEAFENIKRFKEWAAYVGFTYRKRSDGRYFANQFLKNQLFWKLDELPEGCKPIKARCNGCDVKCYVHNDGKTITYYRPNPNAKDVFIPMQKQSY